MDKKKIFAILFFVALIGVFIYLILNQRNSITNQQSPENKESLKVTFENKRISDSTAPFKIEIDYPVFTNAGDINQKIEAFIEKTITEFKANSLENDNAVREADPETYFTNPRQYDLKISYDKGQINENIVSLVFNTYSFEGGAHGATNFIPINYNPKIKAEVELVDVFPTQKDYLKTISDYCIADLKKQVLAKAGSLEGTWIENGAGPETENFSVFLINDKSLTFYFPQYQVAPYALGEFKVVMPR